VQLAQRMSPDILLTVDNGIASVDGVAEAKQFGMDVLVTDQPVEDNTYCKYIH